MQKETESLASHLDLPGFTVLRSIAEVLKKLSRLKISCKLLRAIAMASFSEMSGNLKNNVGPAEKVALQLAIKPSFRLFKR